MDMAIVGGIVDWEAFQKEVSKWAQRNFGDTPQHRPWFGIIEEIGEFQDVGACAGRSKVEDMRDCIGDVMVCMAHYCSLSISPISAIVEEAEYYHGRLQIDILSAIGRISHSALKSAQCIRGNRAYHSLMMFRALVEVVVWGMVNVDNINRVGKAWAEPMTFEQVVSWVWDRVQKRDWKADPERGCETK